MVPFTRLFSYLLTAGMLAAQTAPAPKAAPSKPAAPAAKPAVPAAAKPPAAKPAATAVKPAAAIAPKPAANPNDPVVFRVGTETMTKSQFDSFYDNLPPQVKQQAPNKRAIAQQLSELFALAQEARRTGLANKPDVQQQIKLQSDNILASRMIQNLVEEARKNTTEAKTYYDANLGEFEQAKARHILIRFQGSRVPLKPNQKDLSDAEALEKAKALRERIVKGEDFAALAKAESDDSGSGAQGGDLGSFGRGRMVPEFEKAVFAQKVGEVGEPVKTPFGYHVIQVNERKSQSFDEAKAAIEQKLSPDLAKKVIGALKDKLGITLDEGYFGKPE